MPQNPPDLAQQVAELKARVDELNEEVAVLKNRLEAEERRTDRAALFTARTRAERVLQLTLPTIVGGEETDDFPDCCAVGNALGYYCSGTLIAANLVVTAGHCTEATRVFLKGSDIDVPAEGETITIARSFKIPDVDLRVLLLDWDSQVTPRHVAQGAEVGNPTRGTLVGFGSDDLEGTSGYGKKRLVEVPITTLDCGAPGEASTFGCNPGLELVVGHRGLLKDSCDRDSGGPLYIEDSSGAFLLLGVISRAIRNPDHECGDGSVCVRVDKFLDWIRTQTGVHIPGPSA